MRSSNLIAIFSGFALVLILNFSFGCTSTNIESKFNITLPESAVILSTNHNIWEVDWKVSWLVGIHSKKENIISYFVPTDFEELPFSSDSYSKYHEVSENLKTEYDSKSFQEGIIDVYIGGPDGNSFIGISEDNRQIIYYRFKT